jgi:hypothetical protein
MTKEGASRNNGGIDVPCSYKFVVCYVSSALHTSCGCSFYIRENINKRVFCVCDWWCGGKEKPPGIPGGFVPSFMLS